MQKRCGKFRWQPEFKQKDLIENRVAQNPPSLEQLLPQIYLGLDLPNAAVYHYLAGTPNGKK